MGDAKLELPDKEWYEIQDVAKRWKCSEDDVLHYIHTSKVHPSFYLSSDKCMSVRADLDFDDEGVIERWRSGLFSPVDEHWNSDKNMITTRSNWKVDLKDCYLAEGPPRHIFESESGEMYDNVCILNSKLVTIDDILISNQELHRFESALIQDSVQAEANKCSSSGDIIDKPIKESTRAVENLQRILAAVAMDCYGYDPMVKGNTAVKDILSALLKVKVMVSENTIRTHLKAGVQHIEGVEKN